MRDTASLPPSYDSGVPSEDFYRMTPLEIAGGWITGTDARRPPGEPGATEPGHPVAVLEEIMLPALAAPPCVVSFSGGRDSSALLAVASRLARRKGLAAPIPFTKVYQGVPETEEDEWQEMLIRHLELTDWERLSIVDQVDLLGPLSRDSLERHGLLWPATAHTKSLSYEPARGGTLITGEGGDEIFGPRRITPMVALRAGRVRPRRAALRESILELAPRPVRRPILERRVQDTRGWLRSMAQDRLSKAIARDLLDEPLRWDRSILSVPRRRSWTIGEDTLSRLAREREVRLLNPLLDHRFITSLAEWGGRLGAASRIAIMESLFGDILPPRLVRRQTKAEFGGAVFGPNCRVFARSWKGDGVDTELVSPEQLRETWLQPHPHAGSLVLIQDAWLKTGRPAIETRSIDWR